MLRFRKYCLFEKNHVFFDPRNLKMKRICLLITFFLTILPMVGTAQEVQESPEVLLARAEKLQAEGQPISALTAYMEANRLAPRSPEILWRLGRQYCRLMEDEFFPVDKIRLARVGQHYAHKASMRDPGNAMARLWNAYALQETSYLMTDARGRIAMGPDIYREAWAAIELDADLSEAWLILGRHEWDLALMSEPDQYLAERFYGKNRVPEASVDRAISYFQKAVSLAPQRVAPHLYLGMAYNALGKKELARAELEKAVSIETKEKSDLRHKAEAAALLERTGGSYL